MSTQAISATAQPTTAVGPVSTVERIQVIDILRGFALFGILLVNMAFFKSSWGPEQINVNAEQSLLDRGATLLINLLAEGKFFTLFSFLFGLGFAIQMLRAQDKGVRFVPRFLRRLLVLLLIGLIHMLLIWYGDILVSYALIGFLLILFRNRSPRALLIWAAVLLLPQTLLTAAGISLIEIARTTPEAAAAIAPAETEMLSQLTTTHAQDIAVYGGGSYPAIVAYRLASLPFTLIGSLVSAPTILAMFLLGLYVGKRGIVRDVMAHEAFLRRVRLWGLLLGLIVSGGVILLQQQLSLFSTFYTQFLNIALAGPLLSMGYAATIVLLAQQETWRTRLAPLAATGRMALTNYLLQSLIFTTIFYGYGLGFFGQVGAATGLLLTIVIYALQIPLSAWWLRRFQFGPIEWLWRSLTYLKPQPMRVQREAVAGR
jgi:uncharacterized protein